MNLILNIIAYIVVMAELDAPEHLEDVAAGDVGVEALGVVLQLVQDGVVHKLKDQKQLSLPSENFYQVYQVFMSKSLKGEKLRVE